MNVLNQEHSFVLLAYGQSQYLETCIQSIQKQTIRSQIVISTSTPNEYIKSIGEKYGIKMIVNQRKAGIASDFNFGLTASTTSLVTLAHQDDYYESNYTEEILIAFQKNHNSIILFSDYVEMRGLNIIASNMNLIIKRILLFTLSIKYCNQWIGLRRRILSFGNAISCPSVAYVRSKVSLPLFDEKLSVSLDWDAWETLSKVKGSFVYVPKKLMRHRIHEASMTTSQITIDNRTKEDYEVLLKFWPKYFASFILKFYVLSQKSNKIRKKQES